MFHFKNYVKKYDCSNNLSTITYIRQYDIRFKLQLSFWSQWIKFDHVVMINKSNNKYLHSYVELIYLQITAILKLAKPNSISIGSLMLTLFVHHSGPAVRQLWPSCCSNLLRWSSPKLCLYHSACCPPTSTKTPLSDLCRTMLMCDY